MSIYTLSTAGVDGSKQLIGFVSVAASAAAAAADAAGGRWVEATDRVCHCILQVLLLLLMLLGVGGSK